MTFAVPLPKAKSKKPDLELSEPSQGNVSTAEKDVNQLVDANATGHAQEQRIPQLNYEEPEEGAGLPREGLGFEVIKNGAVVDRLSFPQKNFTTIGRIPICDISLEHPSVSRYHAVVQFMADGKAFLFDLGSAHATLVNKRPLPAKTHVRIHVGDQIRFGASTRTFCLVGPVELDQEKIDAAFEDRTAALEMAKNSVEESTDEGATWGMVEDATEEDDEDDDLPHRGRPSFLRDADAHLGGNHRSADAGSFRGSEDAYYRKDAKKALRTYLEHRGFSVHYETEEDGPGHARIYTSKVNLGFDDDNGPVYGTATGSRRRETEQAAALNGMELLDARGMLKNKASGSNPMADKKARRIRSLLAENDDDDEMFYDKTATGERSKSKKATKVAQVAETYDTLTAKTLTLEKEIRVVQERIQIAKKRKEELAESKAAMVHDDGGDVDAYLSTLRDAEKLESLWELQKQEKQMRKEEERLDKLINIAKPAGISGLPRLADDQKKIHVEARATPEMNETGHREALKRKQDEIAASSSSAPTLESDSLGAPPNAQIDQPQISIIPSRSPPKFEDTQPQGADRKGDPTLTTAIPPLQPLKINSSEHSQSSGDTHAKRRRLAAGPPLPTSESAQDVLPSEAPDTDADIDEAEDLANPADKRRQQMADQLSKGGLVKTKHDNDIAHAVPPPRSSPAKKQKVLPAGLPEKKDDDSDTILETSFDGWLPPAGQSGDGKTALNAKYGY